jgi:hypothetical protein
VTASGGRAEDRARDLTSSPRPCRPARRAMRCGSNRSSTRRPGKTDVVRRGHGALNGAENRVNHRMMR